MPRKAQTESVADVNAAPGGAAAVDKAISLLAAFRSGDRALALGELAERTQLYKSTVLRAIASLEHARLIQKMPDGRYALGSEIARLYSIYAASFSLESIVLPALQELVRQTGESAAYHVRQGDSRLCLYRVDSPHPIRDHVRAGEVLPLYRGAGGRVLVAFDGELLKKAPSEEAEIYRQIVEQGFCATRGDRLAEVAGISAPVFRQDHQLAGALTLTMPAHRYADHYIEKVITTAKSLSNQMP
ncbi:IclR family transcriptional regulator [Noviherbaspirillum sp. L7-7A]|uniref:IclR family transcriptional regulator n=1 Tax=Noviherbaspirillum sp. L7-7A TaxID=2850560 RepID=UPI001C2BCC0E|nr:IclR family transcriptional regulator [Noviherbaspirillum sp. L7-7A]MBV0881542.1 IclR family transcriptional regulator [Noviherbaspirillum sp. L7-7A]